MPGGQLLTATLAPAPTLLDRLGGLTDQAIAEKTEEQAHFLCVEFNHHDSWPMMTSIAILLCAMTKTPSGSLDFKDSKKIHCDATLRNGQFNTQLRLFLGTLENAPKGKCCFKPTQGANADDWFDVSGGCPSTLSFILFVSLSNNSHLPSPQPRNLAFFKFQR